MHQAPAGGLYKAHSWPPSANESLPPRQLPRPFTRAIPEHALPDGRSVTPAPAAAPPVMMSAGRPMTEGDAGADAAQGLLRTLYKQHYGVVSVTCAAALCMCVSRVV